MGLFERYLAGNNVELKRQAINTLQLNITLKCNMACQHCHVDSSPQREEMMSDELIEQVYQLADCYPTLKTVDITGGAPEIHPRFRDMVVEYRSRGLEVIDRCNLTILLEPGFEDLAQFLANQQVHIVASLPCYIEKNVDRQRGKGAYSKSLEALERLNNLGYGMQGSGLELDLVYNPIGAQLPPPQEQLQRDYKRELKRLYGISFNQLLTITNMPIKRFAHYLKVRREYDSYMSLLMEKFNPHAAAGIMCMHLISISWDGRVFDCDFNQMEELGLAYKNLKVEDLLASPELIYDKIATGKHCFGCTAGSGSGCYGSVV